MQFIEQQTGICLNETSYRQVHTYLEERQQSLGLNIEGFISRLQSDREEREAFFDAVTINETYFFREERHFLALESHIFPILDKTATRPLQFWSAACSTGEEAISISALASGHWPVTEFRTFASDINTNALARLERGEYAENSFREDGGRYHCLLKTEEEADSGLYRVPEHLSRTIRQRNLNLSDPVYTGIPAGLHLVFLRNMMIYVKFENRTRILDRIVSLMAEGGYLFLSSSEVPLLGHPHLVLENCCGCYFFRKKNLQEKRDGPWPRKGDSISPVGPVGGKAQQVRCKPVFPAVDEILIHVSQKLNNPVYHAGDEGAFLAALAYLETVYLLNSSDPADAMQAINTLVSRWGDNEITNYLKGMAALRVSNSSDAKKWFESALRKSAGFWPAYYQLGILLGTEAPERALQHFIACRRSINAYISRGAFTYQFLLDGFSARYFDSICQGWISKLQGEGVAHGT